MAVCDVCGKPTTSPLGVCSNGSPECHREYRRRNRAAAPPGARAAQDRARYAINRDAEIERGRKRREATPEVFRDRVRKWGEANREAKREHGRRWRAANLELARECEAKYRASHPAALRAAWRKYLARADRPCRDAACPELAPPGLYHCREHHNAAILARYHRMRRMLHERLAAEQGQVCPWCELPLPGDLAERLPSGLAAIALDHIIPRARGGPDEDWNL